MKWIFLIVSSIFIGICPRLIANTVQNVVETNYWERDRKVNRLNNLILFFTWVIIITAVAYPYLFDINKEYHDKIEALEKRIEALETPPQVDTINVVDIIKENGNF